MSKNKNLGPGHYSPAAREALIGIAVSVAFAIGLVYYLEHLSDSDEKACKELDAKYGEMLTASKGPFKGVNLKAMRFSDTSITVMPPDLSEMVFSCKELERLK